MAANNSLGAATSLNCTVDARATKETFLIAWTQERSSVSPINTRSSSTLWFDPLIASHAGIYICNASLDFTSGNEKMNLTIKCKLEISHVICHYGDYCNNCIVSMDVMIFLNTTNPVMAGDSVSIICNITIDKTLLDVGVDVDLHLVSPQKMNAFKEVKNSSHGQFQTSVTFHNISARDSGKFICNGTIQSSLINEFLIPAHESKTFDLILSKFW